MAKLTPANIQFFASPDQFREWLEKNSETSSDVWVGFYKRDTGKPSLTWPESVDAALCYGWIDGIRKTLDEVSYTIRFTPRNPDSVWSSLNIRKAEEQIRAGLMKPAGLIAFELRKDSNSGIYSYEQQSVEFPESFIQMFKQNVKAWDFFSAMPPSYRKVSTRWVMSAKQEQTRLKRLETLIRDSENGMKITELRR